MASVDRLRDLSEEALLALRFRDLPTLGVRWAGTEVAGHAARLLGELRARGLRLRPHFWLSDEWFSPDGIAGIAVPFYLAHPRLVALERRQMGRAEGETAAECLRILRHEAGHAVENAYRLRRRTDRRRIFGPTSQRYPRAYSPRPHSRRYVRHLPERYAQSHPDEDFAETFAVWLDPSSAWRRRYARWAAREKLEYMDSLMGALAGKPPLRSEAGTPGALPKLSRTLGEHYRRRRAHYAPALPEARPALTRAFRAEGDMTAARYLRTIRATLRRSLADRTGARRFDVDRVVAAMIREVRALGLRADAGDRRRRAFVTELLAKTTRECLDRGHHLVPL